MKKTTPFLLLIPTLFVTTLVPAQDFSDPLAMEVNRCAKITDDAQRLNCFDAVVVSVRDESVSAELETATEAVVVAQVEPVASVEKATVIGEKYVEPIEKQQTEEKTVVQLKSAEKDKRGRWVFYLDNDQVWRQLEVDFILIPKTPVSVEVIKGKLGSHRMRLPNQNKTHKVTRIK